jgi:hypothetical protein
MTHKCTAVLIGDHPNSSCMIAENEVWTRYHQNDGQRATMVGRKKFLIDHVLGWTVASIGSRRVWYQKKTKKSETPMMTGASVSAWALGR